MNDLIRDKIKTNVYFQDIIKTDNLCYKSKNRKVFNFSEYFLSYVSFRDIHEGHLLLKDTDDEQSNC